MSATPPRRPSLSPPFPLALLPLLLVACASLSESPPALPVPPVPRRDPLVDIEHYDVNVDIDHRANHIDGTVAVLFRALPNQPADRLLLDAVEMQVHGVWDHEGRNLACEQRENQLVIRLAEPVRPGAEAEVTIDYSCFPRRGMYVIAPSASDPGRPWQLWTQGETHETRFWVPCWDQPNDRATLTLHATVDGSFITLGPGQRTSMVVNENTGRRTDTWQMDTPHVSYLMTLVAGQLAEGQIPGGPVPLPVIARAEALPHALQNFAATPDILAFLAEFTGRPYPYAKYAQSCIQEFVAGGQENISATTLLHETIHDPADEPQDDSLDLIAHEAAHQWFGDLITCRNWDDLWLNEGFATYLEVLYQGRARGQDRLRQLWQSTQQKYLAAAQAFSHPIAWRDFPDPDATFDEHAYEGAAARLLLLEELVGEDAFRRGVQLYVQRRENGIVVTDDFQRDMEEATGADLGQFFAEWFHGVGFPEFGVRLSHQRVDAPTAAGTPDTPDDMPGRRESAFGPTQANVLEVTQFQSLRGWREVFHLPVTVTWSRGGLERSQRFDIDERVELLPLEGEGALSWVRFDSTTAVPGTVRLVQSEAMWADQLRGASDGVTRLLAAQWFALDEAAGHVVGSEGWQPSQRSIGQLIEAAQLDPFVDVRVQALEALAERHDARLAAVFEHAIRDKEAPVREAAAAGLSRQGGDEVLPALLAATEDGNAAVVAAALGALVDRGFPGAYRLCADTARRTDKFRLDAAIVRAIARIEGEPDVLPFLLSAARREPVPRVRAAAIAALAEQPDPDAVVFRALGELLNDGSHIVRGAAVRSLQALDAPRAAPLLLARRSIEIDGDVLRALDDALAGDGEG